MSTFWNRRTFIKVALGGLFARRAFAQTRITSTALTDNVFLLTGAGTHVVAKISPDGVVLVDGGLAEHAPALLQTVATLSGGRPISILFNTCWFPEQTGANQIIGQTGATIIAHENTRLWMTTDIERPWETRVFPAAPREARPNKTFYDKGTITAGNETIEYGYMLQAHTDGDIYVFVPESNILAV